MTTAENFKLPELPISSVLPEIRSTLEQHTNLVLVAPPGAGKTTLVPLALLNAPWRNGNRILVLEPRRLAARAAASRMASLLGEKVGERVGYRIRFDTRVSSNTIIEVVTEGVFNRMLTQDPGLETVAAVLFDEFHERSLGGDLALALCLDLQAGLREDLRLIPMSATLDGAAVSELMNAEIIESEGRSFPVEMIYRERAPQERIEPAMATALRIALAEEQDGSILAFLPGQGEIERTAGQLEDRLPPDTDLHKLYGALSQREQDAAIRPPEAGRRKIVLASAIAETSLTIEGINTVVDSGLSRQPVFEPSTGLTRLQTVRASQASITQRAGRAGRLAPGRAIRLWRAEQTAALPRHTPPEILNADLSALLLDLADWGVSDVRDLQWLNPPPPSAVAEARALLTSLGALNEEGILTKHGRAMRKLPLPPRLANMVVRAGAHGKQAALDAAMLALLVQERGVGGHDLDLGIRLENLHRGRKDKRSANIVRLAHTMADGLSVSNTKEDLAPGVLLAFAYPDRIAQSTGQSRDGSMRFRLANGRGAEMEATASMAHENFLVVVDMAGRAGAARILSAAPLNKNDLLQYFSDLISKHTVTEFNVQTGRMTATQTTKLGALALDKPAAMKLTRETIANGLMTALEKNGLDILPWRDADRALRARLDLLHTLLNETWPDMSDSSLIERREEWVLPFLGTEPDFTPLSSGALSDGLLLLAGHPSKAELERLLPTHFKAPSGSNLPLAYEGEKVVLRVRPQELFGLKTHPVVLDGKLAMEIELLSPAGRPIQITRDLPQFWRGSWADVRADLRGRYPKHPWPEDPANADATHRTKPRKT